jgi:5'-deoxynucleotidase YfbR-like HD superfamily hydrolase
VNAWLATFTRRWHANPDLCQTVDPVGGHSARMGVLALSIWGESASRDLLAACLVHDLGESRAGDVPQPAKRDARLSAELDRLERETLADLGFVIKLTEDDARRLKFLDRLDAYLWAQHHAPHVLARSGWCKDRSWLEAEGDGFGVRLDL